MPPVIVYVCVINMYLFILSTLVPRVLGFSRIFWADLNHAPGVRSLQADCRLELGCGFQQIWSRICVCGHSPPLSGKQRARKSPFCSARVPHRHLLQRSDWLFDTSLRTSPAPRQLALANGWAACSTGNTIRRRTRLMPVVGRKVPVVFMRRVFCSVVEFHWTCFSLRLGWKPSLRSWLVR